MKEPLEEPLEELEILEKKDSKEVAIDALTNVYNLLSQNSDEEVKLVEVEIRPIYNYRATKEEFEDLKKQEEKLKEELEDLKKQEENPEDLKKQEGNPEDELKKKEETLKEIQGFFSTHDELRPSDYTSKSYDRVLVNYNLPRHVVIKKMEEDEKSKGKKFNKVPGI